MCVGMCVRVNGIYSTEFSAQGAERGKNRGEWGEMREEKLRRAKCTGRRKKEGRRER